MWMEIGHSLARGSGIDDRHHGIPTVAHDAERGFSVTVGDESFGEDDVLPALIHSALLRRVPRPYP